MSTVVMATLFLQDGPAHTTSYMIAGYAVIFGVMLIYLVSLVIRNRNLKQDLELLEDLEKKS
jgi:hypothetical protein